MTKQELEKALIATPEWKAAELAAEQLLEAMHTDYKARLEVSKLAEYKTYMDTQDD